LNFEFCLFFWLDDSIHEKKIYHISKNKKKTKKKQKKKKKNKKKQKKTKKNKKKCYQIVSKRHVMIQN